MKRLYRSRTDRKLAGVCGGLGDHLNMDPTIVRLLFVALFLLTGFIPLGAAYLVAWWIVPEAPAAHAAGGTGAGTQEAGPGGAAAPPQTPPAAV